MAGQPRADEREDQGDVALVCRAEQGDQLALEELVRRHQAWVYSLAQRMVGGPTRPRTPPRRS